MVTRTGAVETAVHLRVVSLRCRYCWMARGKITEIDAIVNRGHEPTTLPMDFVISVRLCVLVDVVVGHRKPPFVRGLSREGWQFNQTRKTASSTRPQNIVFPQVIHRHMVYAVDKYRERAGAIS